MSDKAKQFMPFDALKDLKEELKKKEKIDIEKPLLDDDALYELSNKILQYKKGDF